MEFYDVQCYVSGCNENLKPLILQLGLDLDNISEYHLNNIKIKCPACQSIYMRVKVRNRGEQQITIKRIVEVVGDTEFI